MAAHGEHKARSVASPGTSAAHSATAPQRTHSVGEDGAGGGRRAGGGVRLRLRRRERLKPPHLGPLWRPSTPSTPRVHRPPPLYHPPQLQ